MTPTQVLIHFVGLCLFTSQVPNDCGNHVILPQVIYTDPSSWIASDAASAPKPVVASTRQSNAKPAAAPAAQPAVPGNAPSDHPHVAATQIGPAVHFGPSPHVEDHVAILAFPTASLAPGSVVNWGTPIALPNTGTLAYSYVKLDGDRVRFETNTNDNPIATLANVKLPPLQKLCGPNALTSPFLPPYEGAAAIFDLPVGTLNACMAGQRVDTEVSLSSNGFLVISASTIKMTKEIRLKPGPSGRVDLIVANIPKSCLTGACTPKLTTAIDGVSHAHEYYAMVGANSAACSSVGAWISDPVNARLIPQSACVMSVPAAAGGLGMEEHLSKNTPPPTTQVYNFECSNTQWP
jgi:hypothetical protein